MMTRAQYSSDKQRQRQRLEAEVFDLERQLDHARELLAALERETFEEAKGDYQYEKWKAQRDA